MTSEQFVFSNKIVHRMARHTVFWLFFSLHLLLFRYYVFDLKYLAYATTYIIRLQNLLLFLPCSFFYAYFSIYFLLPRYIIKGRYLKLLAVVILLTLILLTLSYLISTVYNIRLAWDIPLNRQSIVRQMDFTVNNGLVYPLTVSGFGIGIKMGKNFYLQQLQNETLEKEKVNAELQLLKSGIHPRFLFRSLNSIYADMRNGSTKSPAMVLQLSDLLSYMLYESSDRLMPLEKELNLLQDYIELEKESLDPCLTIQKEIKADTANRFIAPLLLLPIAAFLFEEVEKSNEGKYHLTIDIKEEENRFLFRFEMSGIGEKMNTFIEGNTHLKQIGKRLQTLSVAKNDFNVARAKESIVVCLSLLLNEKP